MSKKKLNKTVWYGSDVDLQGNAILPPLAESREDLNGIHEGEIYLHNQDDDPGIWVRTNKGNVKRIGFNKKDFDLSEYLKKQVWDTAWELRTTEEGESYIFCKLPFISQHGVTLYADGGNIDLPSLYAGIPVDEITITKREDGTLMLNPNLELGGLDETALQKYLDDYKYAKLSDIPSLDGYAKLTDVDSRINDLVNGAPAAYDTLKEIADVLQGNVNSIGDIITTLGTKADKTELAKYIPIAGDTEVTGIKNFLNGLKVGGLPISKYEGHDDVIYIDANVVLRGGLTQYAVDPVTIPSIIDSLPQAGYESKGVASFSDKYFVIDTNGKVSIIPDSVGLNEEELAAWLASSDYATKTYVGGQLESYALQSALTATNNTLATKWTQDDDKIANWDTAYGWGNHASAGYALSTEVAVELAKYLPLKGGTLTGHITLPNKIYIRTESNSYAILGMDGNKYILAAPNKPTTIRSNGTLKHNDAIIWDSNTLTSLSQLTNDADFTTNEYVNETFVTLKGDPQTIEGEKDFIGGLKVNGSPIVYDSEKGYWLLQGNLLITGGLTQYVDDGSVDLPNLYDGLPIDNQTIYWEETANGKVLKAKVAEGGITSITDTMIIEALGYTPYDASNPNGYITSAALSGYATQTWVNQQGFLTEHQDLSGYQTKITSTNKLAYSLISGTPDLSVYLTTSSASSTYQPKITSSAKLAASLVSGLATVATSGSYNDLSNKPTIPTNTNQLTNGAGFITSSGYCSGVLDYGNTSAYIKIGYTGTGLTATNAQYLAAYGQNASGERVIKDISKSEVQSWLGLGSNAYNSTAYLPLSGGQIDGNLIINRNPSVIFFKRSGTNLGSIGFNGDLNPVIYNAASNAAYNLWHSGNSNLSSVDWNASKLILNTTNTTDWNVAVRNSTIQLLRTGETAGNAPYSYSSGISIMTSYTGFQLASHGGSSNELYFRSVRDDGAWLPWETVAFINSNVASATKLQTARKIWGQSFDGTGDITGQLNITGSLTGGMTQGAGALCIGYLTGGHLMLDTNDIQAKSNGTTPATLYINDWGGNVVFCSTSGNVGIGTGTTSPAQKLHVAGTTYLAGSVYIGTSSNGYMAFLRPSANYIVAPVNGYFAFCPNGSSSSVAGSALLIQGDLVTVGYNGANFLCHGGITQYSDIRKKTKLQDVELTLKQVANAPLIEHYYNSDDKKTTHVGSIAQYWAEMNDWFCKLDSDGYYTMEIQNAALASAISVARELERYESKTDKKIRMLKKRINELEDEIEKLKK